MMLTTIPAKTIMSNNFEFFVIVYLRFNAVDEDFQ